MVPAPSAAPDRADAHAAYLAALAAGDSRRAVLVAVGLLDEGLAAVDVLVGLVAAAQEDVGAAWQDRRWTVAQEHRATAIAEEVVQAVCAIARRDAPTPVGEGHVVVASVEGEWHVLPGRLVSEVLRLQGFDVDFVGPSLPAEDLARFLGAHPPGVVALSCSMPMSLVGAWHTIAALRANGKTIVCGGRGFGPDGRWALALGADLWAPDIAAGAEHLRRAVRAPHGFPRPDAVPRDVAAEITQAARQFPALVDAAAGLAASRWPRLRGGDDPIRDTRGMLTLALRSVLAAALVDDAQVVLDHVAWAQSVVASRLLPPSVVAESFMLVQAVLPADLARCAEMAGLGLAACSQPPPVDLAPHRS